jgi:deazaflavin-dependent oxidoreductase (nitroreductase family)
MTAPIERPVNWIEDHLNRYLETNGEDGHIFSGVPTLLLTTMGRKTGQPYTTPLIYGQDGDRYLLVASRGGAPTNPGWYRNLVIQPDVEIQVKADRFSVRARTATPEEKGPLWELMAKIWPNYDEYKTKTTREIPLVILER